MTTPDPNATDVPPPVAVDRPADDQVSAIADLQKRLADLETTVMMRASRQPTGTVEMTLLSSPRADCLFLLGQTVSRATYAVLWQWVQDNGMVATNRFTVGDGSTTFGLPNMSGRVPVGVGTLGSDVYAVGDFDGAASNTISHTLTQSEMPNHSHGVSVNDHGAHSHGISGDGSHSGHQPSGFGAAGGGAALVQYNNVTDGFHNHGGADGNTNVSGHSLSQSAIGGGNSFSIVAPTFQPSLAWNWMIWT